MKCARRVQRKLRKQVAGPKWQGPRRLLRHNLFTTKQRQYIGFLIKSKKMKKLEAYVKMTVAANNKLAEINKKASEAQMKKCELKPGLYNEVCNKCNFAFHITIKNDQTKHTEAGGEVVRECKHCK